MPYRFKCLLTFSLAGILTESVFGGTIFNNLTPNNSIGIASRPFFSATTGSETADDFSLSSQTLITSATFVGLIVPSSSGTPDIAEVVTQVYRLFPLDSNTGRTPQVPTRVNSPSDVDHGSKDSGASELTFTSSVLSLSFTVLNSVQPGGIHQTTHGNGTLTGQEVQITANFTNPFNLPADHYFFVPQVALTNGGQFYWLSASRPISGAGTTPFPAGVSDLQVWTRDDNLDPDWLRVGTDIVGGTAFNAAFSLDGTAVPEPRTTFMVLAGLAFLCSRRSIAAIRKVTR